MKIWLDLRLTNNPWLFSDFIVELTKELILKNNEISFTIYCNNSEILENFPKKENIEIKNVNIKNWSLEEQTSFYSMLKKDKNDLVVFFDHNKPILYKKRFIFFVYSLENIYYQNFDNITSKYKYLFLLKNALKHSEKIVCFENNIVEEINERFNTSNNKIKTIKWFFTGSLDLIKDDFIKIDVKSRYNIKNDFFIYNSWAWIHKNIERLLNVIKRLKDLWKNIDLVFLWNDISKQIYIREAIINFKLQNEVFFLWEIKEEEKRNLYSKSLWVVLPSFYEPFPFSLKDAIKNEIPIIASNIQNIKNIFWEQINYFSPISTSNIEKIILEFLSDKDRNKINYDNILDIYNKDNTTEEFLKIIV